MAVKSCLMEYMDKEGVGLDHKDGLLPVVSQSGNAVGVGVGLLLKLNI